MQTTESQETPGFHAQSGRRENLVRREGIKPVFLQNNIPSGSGHKGHAVVTPDGFNCSTGFLLKSKPWCEHGRLFGEVGGRPGRLDWLEDSFMRLSAVCFGLWKSIVAYKSEDTARTCATEQNHRQDNVNVKTGFFVNCKVSTRVGALHQSFHSSCLSPSAEENSSTEGSEVGDGRECPALDQVGRFLPDHDARRHRVSGWHFRHDARVRHTQPRDPVHPGEENP